ncbi:glycerol-3-phosphate dehydrogenase/oxidase [Arcticibacterium luteifluviistationis]|uniref:FAD-dependent oxidoreductase n=1 Tax=Arcticibacterium luteifluviistationis TaxID=1784714 RepID=A0A2Z4GB10_9BACT|nr:FAD-dependent oxidoreductase [Arcticibacterium luteifluviistationis]AWV98311.1 FAD-dependent oxidoreductase [Arcticibacterium luteifluviistationis]
MDRKHQLGKLRTEKFDICIIGAGSSGSGAVLDAVLRGYKVALIDKNDFCAETSSKSTKLIHGGVRYLERAFKQLDLEQLRQVRHGLHERKTLLTIAPHLAKPIPLITPVFSWFEGMYYSIGLKLYGMFAAGDGLPSAKWLSKADTLKRMPGLTQEMHSSVLYYDGTFNDAAFSLAMVSSAEQKGAIVANYVSLTNFEKNAEGKLSKALVKDEISGEDFEIDAKLFINCTGPFADDVRLMADKDEESRMRPAKGVHFVFPSELMKGEDAMLIPETKDGRVVFVKPIGNKIMVGTTDTAYTDMAHEPILESKEVDYLLETVNPFLEKPLERKDITSGFGGVRPLLAPKSSKRKETKALLRDHEVEYLPESGLLSLLGGKWTTYRVMAKDVIDYAGELLNKQAECVTASHKLVGAQNSAFLMDVYKAKASKLLSEDTVEHLYENYGDLSLEVLMLVEREPALAEKLHTDYPFIKAEAAFAVKREMATKLRDFFARRIRMELLDWEATKASIDKVAPIFQRNLAWSDEEMEANKKEYADLLDKFQRVSGI